MLLQGSYEGHCLVDVSFEVDLWRNFLLVGMGQQSGDDNRRSLKLLGEVLDELLEIEMMGHGCEVGVDVIGLFQLVDVLHVLQGNVGAQVNGVYPTTLQHVIHEQQTDFVVFAFGEEEQHRLVHFEYGGYIIDAHDELLADEVGHQVFLRRINVVGEPKDADLFHEGKDDLADGSFNALGSDRFIEQHFNGVDVQIHHVLDHFIDHPFLLGLRLVQGNNLLLHFFIAHLVDVRNLEPIFIQQGDVQHLLQFLIAVMTDVSGSPQGLQKAVPLFPNANGVGLDAGNVFQILYGK